MSTPVVSPSPDSHTFARPTEAVVRHLDLTLSVRFEEKKLIGKAVYDIVNQTGTDAIFFDTQQLNVEHVTIGAPEVATEFSLEPEDATLGRALKVKILPDTRRVTLYYQTTPDAAALQWLSPAQTAGKEHPFLFTQGQAILTRSWIPVQDSPGIRFTYNAHLKVPEALMAVMSAVNPTERSSTGEYHFHMPQPVPAYLIALAVGNLVFEPISERTGVYAEPETIEKAAYEFAELPHMLEAAETLYGPYEWERYDLLVLPPSFPFGGMENPRLTFATPTILAGDRSLTSLVAHELAHSWSGNLVTNATWNDFWLNEGFTVYFERRIIEALYGSDYAAMLEALGWQDLQHTVAELGTESADTQLKLALEGRNPDDGMNDIAYEKGYFLLRLLEEHVGRDRFDAFLRQYFADHKFQTMDTERFITYLQEHFLEAGAFDSLQVNQWIYGVGIPKNATKIDAAKFAEVDNFLHLWISGGVINKNATKDWSSHEWLHFIRQLPREVTSEQMAALDNAFHFTQSGNAEIQAAWYELAIRHQYTPAYNAVEAFLTEVGRRKFLVPLYKAFKETGQLSRARAIYQQARPGYHYVSQATLDQLLKS
ncbi:leukotriene A-4 hydrolase/aminopeptidase [Catalinimonas alkaloidigena]|uniref:Aminopeptidase N n=2 Tax=Catalinimonas alkaloidigena TaxID=1075417 RepID=A0A1G9EVX5_9BACT|nr:leukotriene A-4 hydrolase/aminopeptidase [Catalinimonas alkaloidigena]